MDQLYQYALNSKNEKLCLDILRVRITDNPYDLTFLGQGGEFAEIRNGNPKFNGLKELCHKIIQYKQELNWQSNDSIRQAIRSIYLQMGNQDAADLYN